MGLLLSCCECLFGGKPRHGHELEGNVYKTTSDQYRRVAESSGYSEQNQRNANYDQHFPARPKAPSTAWVSPKNGIVGATTCKVRISGSDSKTIQTQVSLTKGQLRAKYMNISKDNQYVNKTNFLELIRNNNRNLLFKWDAQQSLTYYGVKEHIARSTSYAFEITVDLHGMIVAHAVQILESIIKFYSDKMNNKLCHLTKRVIVKLIVGKGFSNADGKSILGPKLSEYLTDICYDHIINNGTLTVNVVPR